MRQVEVSIHAMSMTDPGEMRQASVKMDVPACTDQKSAEVIALAVADAMTMLWQGYRVTATATVVETTREVVSYGDVRFQR